MRRLEHHQGEQAEHSQDAQPVQRRHVGRRQVTGAAPQLGGNGPEDDRAEDPAVEQAVAVDVEREPDPEYQRPQPADVPQDVGDRGRTPDRGGAEHDRARHHDGRPEREGGQDVEEQKGVVHGREPYFAGRRRGCDDGLAG